MSKDKVILKTKKWLSPNTTAFIHTQLMKDGNYFYGDLKLADCSRIVSFDIDANDNKDRAATVKKLNIMIDEITKLRDTIEAIPNEQER